MSDPKINTCSPYLFMAAGGGMLLAAWLTHQGAFLGPGALFLVLGASKLRPTR